MEANLVFRSCSIASPRSAFWWRAAVDFPLEEAQEAVRSRHGGLGGVFARTRVARADPSPLQCFGRGDGELVIVPKIIGQTQQAADRRRAQRGTQRSWPPATLKEQYEELALTDPLRARRLDALVSWAVKQQRFIESVARNACFSIGTEQGKRLLTFQLDGDIHWYIANSLEILGETVRERFYERLIELGVVDDSHHPDRVTSSKSLTARLDELSDEQYEALRELIQGALEAG
jgi:hypothetical protein